MEDRIKSTAVSVVATSLLAMFALGAETVQAKGVVASATGGYVATYLGTTREVGFTAKEDKKGRVRGQVQLTNLDTGASLHYTVDCLHVEGNQATISGLIAERDLLNDPTTGLPLPYFWLRVWDNGESEVPQDLVSYLVVHDFETTCEEDLIDPDTGFNFGSIQVLIDDGNIQVGQSNELDIP